MRKQLSRYLSHGLTRNILALYGMQFVIYFLPLITIPYLTRVLGPTTWGLVAFAQAFGQCVVLLVEYGFNLSATRMVACHKDSKEKLAEILAGVLGAKGLIATFTIVLAILVQHWVTSFQDHPAILWAAIFWALIGGISPIWYFQGLERMGLVASLGICLKFLTTVGIFLLVHSPEDGWKVLASLGIGTSFSTAVVIGMAYREVPFRFPTRSLVWEALQNGWSMFLFQSSVSLYTVANSFILGLFAPPQFVGYYAGAEKISKSFLGLMGPVSGALYPRLSYLVHHNRDRAAQLARIGLSIMGIGGVLMGLIVFLLAPLLVHIILGKEFDYAVPVLRVLALLPPLSAVSNSLGIQWMLPLGLDRPFNNIVMGGGLLNLILAILLAPHFAHMGMAVAVVITEVFITGSIYVLLRYQELDPITYASKVRDPI